MMRFAFPFAVVRILPVVLLSLSSLACGDDGSHASEPAPLEADRDTDDSASAERAILEADIVQTAEGRLYAMSKSGSVAVVDVSMPGRLTLLGKTRIAGQPFEMYRRGNFLVTMSMNAFEKDGRPVAFQDESRWPEPVPDRSSAVIVLDVTAPEAMVPVATHVVPGNIDDSRVVGDVLYLVTTESSSCWSCTRARTRVTSYSLGDAARFEKIDDASFKPPWKNSSSRSVSMGKDRVYLGGSVDGSSPSSSEGVIDVVDISDPHGRLAPGAQLRVPGPIYTRWQIDERGDVLRVISQPGASGSTAGSAMPSVDTFQIESSASFKALGHAEMSIPRDEGLRGVRFDDDRAYAITYERTDPLYVLDLSDPTAPRQRGELHIPGFVFHLEPHGDRVLGVGVDSDDSNGALNLSLFDVSDLDRPTMLKRVAFGERGRLENDGIAKTQLAEDYDRIQKAVRVLDDGLVVIPFSGTSGRYGTGDTCDSVTSGVQLVEWKGDSLTKRAFLPLRGNPRRAFENQGELITVSDSNVRTFSLADRDRAVPTADVVIGTCVSRYGEDPLMCAVRAPGNGARGTAVLGSLCGVLVFALGRRARSSRATRARTSRRGRGHSRVNWRPCSRS
jgi:hypothetical protein